MELQISYCLCPQVPKKSIALGNRQRETGNSKDIHWISRIANLCPASWEQRPQTPPLMESLDAPWHPQFKTLRKDSQRIFMPGWRRTRPPVFVRLQREKHSESPPNTTEKWNTTMMNKKAAAGRLFFHQPLLFLDFEREVLLNFVFLRK